MATPTNLYQYYQQQGKSLPKYNVRFSDPAFASAAQKAGVSQSQYVGSAEQNTAILNQLLAKPKAQGPAPAGASDGVSEPITSEVLSPATDITTTTTSTPAMAPSTPTITTPTAYQGPVPKGYDEETYRKTGRLVPITPTPAPPAPKPEPAAPTKPPAEPKPAPPKEPEKVEEPEKPKEPEPDYYALTPEQKEVQTLIDETRKLYDKLVGESEYRTQQEEAEGLPSLEASRRDLTAQLNALIAESKGIPLGLTTRRAKEMGISTTGITSLQRDDLRENAIKSLTVSSLLQATQGNLAFAQDQVEKAVDTKYDPILEEIEVKLANLELLSKSPEVTQSEKQRAEAAKAEENKRREEVAAQKKQQEEIWKIAVDAAEGGADATTLREIQNAETKEEALRLATPFIQKEKKGVGAPRGASIERQNFEGTDREYVQELFELNPDATDAEVEAQLQQDTNLGQSEINTLLNTRVNSDDIRFEAEELLVDFFNPGLFKTDKKDKEEALEEAKAELETLRVITFSKAGGGKVTVTLTPELKVKIISEMEIADPKRIRRLFNERK